MERKPKKKKQYYVLFIRGDVEPEKYGPFPTEEKMDEEAKRLRKEEGEDEGGIFPVEAEGEFNVGCFSGGFLDDVEPDPSES
jgi:hypothetical protein